MSQLSKNVSLLMLSCLFAGSALATEPSVTSPRVSGLLQSWFLTDNSSSLTNSNFRVRRAEIRLTGSMAERTRYFVVLDGAKNLDFTSPSSSATKDGKVLQDVGIAYSLTDQLELIAGQFKGLSTAEGLDSSSELYFPERSRVARRYGDKGKQGAQALYQGQGWKLGAMVSNGGETNTNDTSTAKELSIRAEAATPIEGLQFAAFIQSRDMRLVLDRDIGSSIRLKRGDLLLRGEFITGRTESRISEGWVMDSGYQFLDGKLMPLVRYERIQTDISSNLIASGWCLGLNAFIKNPQAKFQIAYSLLENFTGNNGSYEESNSALSKKTRLLTAAYSMAF